MEPLKPEIVGPARNTKRKREYFGIALPEFYIPIIEALVRKLIRMDPEHDPDFLRSYLAQLYQIALGIDQRGKALGLKMIGDLAGLAVVWEHKKRNGLLPAPVVNNNISIENKVDVSKLTDDELKEYHAVVSKLRARLGNGIPQN